MIINYMLPVSVLIVLSTVYSLNGIRKINLELSKLELTSSAESLNALKNELDLMDGSDKRHDCSDEEIASLRGSKTCLKMLCIVQTSYDLVWFVAVLALENVTFSSSMSVVYSVTSCLLVRLFFNSFFVNNNKFVCVRTGTFSREPSRFCPRWWGARI